MVGDILQPTHLLLVLVVALLVLGPKRLPEVGRQLGNGLRDFRSAINGERAEHVEPPAEHYEPPAEHYEPPAEHYEPPEPAQESGQKPLETAVGREPAQPPLEHEFAHEASEPTPESHEFAHDGPRATVANQAETSGSTGEHEFAYEGSEPAEKRVDPLG